MRFRAGLSTGSHAPKAAPTLQTPFATLHDPGEAGLAKTCAAAWSGGGRRVTADTIATPSTDDVVAWLKPTIEPGSVVELRTIGCVDNPRYKSFTMAGWFDSGHLGELAREPWNGPSGPKRSGRQSTQSIQRYKREPVTGSRKLIRGKAPKTGTSFGGQVLSSMPTRSGPRGSLPPTKKRPSHWRRCTPSSHF